MPNISAGSRKAAGSWAVRAVCQTDRVDAPSGSLSMSSHTTQMRPTFHSLHRSAYKWLPQRALLRSSPKSPNSPTFALFHGLRAMLPEWSRAHASNQQPAKRGFGISTRVYLDEAVSIRAACPHCRRPACSSRGRARRIVPRTPYTCNDRYLGYGFRGIALIIKRYTIRCPLPAPYDLIIYTAAQENPMSSVRFSKTLLTALTYAALITACKAPEAPTLAASDEPAASTQPAAAAKDPNAIDAPIKADAYQVKLSLSGAPAPAADNKTITYQVKVDNEGSTPIYGVGNNAVNIGISVLGDDGTPRGAGGVLDFSRARLPLIAPGQSSLVAVVIPADSRLAGRSVRLATVQENVAWHEGEGTLVLGPFQVSDRGTISVKSESK